MNELFNKYHHLNAIHEILGHWINTWGISLFLTLSMAILIRAMLISVNSKEAVLKALNGFKINKYLYAGLILYLISFNGLNYWLKTSDDLALKDSLCNGDSQINVMIYTKAYTQISDESKREVAGLPTQQIMSSYCK